MRRNIFLGNHESSQWNPDGILCGGEGKKGRKIDKQSGYFSTLDCTIARVIIDDYPLQLKNCFLAALRKAVLFCPCFLHGYKGCRMEVLKKLKLIGEV